MPTRRVSCSISNIQRANLISGYGVANEVALPTVQLSNRTGSPICPRAGITTVSITINDPES